MLCLWAYTQTHLLPSESISGEETSDKPLFFNAFDLFKKA